MSLTQRCGNDVGSEPRKCNLTWTLGSILSSFLLGSNRFAIPGMRTLQSLSLLFCLSLHEVLVTSDILRLLIRPNTVSETIDVLLRAMPPIRHLPVQVVAGSNEVRGKFLEQSLMRMNWCDRSRPRHRRRRAGSHVRFQSLPAKTRVKGLSKCVEWHSLCFWLKFSIVQSFYSHTRSLHWNSRRPITYIKDTPKLKCTTAVQRRNRHCTTLSPKCLPSAPSNTRTASLPAG